jgi:hypothetical protein
MSSSNKRKKSFSIMMSASSFCRGGCFSRLPLLPDQPPLSRLYKDERLFRLGPDLLDELAKDELVPPKLLELAEQLLTHGAPGEQPTGRQIHLQNELYGRHDDVRARWLQFGGDADLCFAPRSTVLNHLAQLLPDKAEGGSDRTMLDLRCEALRLRMGQETNEQFITWTEFKMIHKYLYPPQGGK